MLAAIDPEFLVIRRKRCAPRGLALGIWPRRRMAEEIHVERLVRSALAMAAKLLAHGIEVEHRAGQRAQPAGVRNGNRHRAALDAGHGRLDDRQVDAKELFQRHRSSGAQRPRLRRGSVIRNQQPRVYFLRTTRCPAGSVQITERNSQLTPRRERRRITALTPHVGFLLRSSAEHVAVKPQYEQVSERTRDNLFRLEQLQLGFASQLPRVNPASFEQGLFGQAKPRRASLEKGLMEVQARIPNLRRRDQAEIRLRHRR